MALRRPPHARSRRPRAALPRQPRSPARRPAPARGTRRGRARHRRGAAHRPGQPPRRGALDRGPPGARAAGRGAAAAGRLVRPMSRAVMAAGIAAGKIALSILSAFAVVYFRFPGRMLAFWAIFASLLLPVEVRIVPTYEVVANVLAPLAWAARALGGGAAFAGLAEPGVAVAVRSTAGTST